MPDGTGLSKFEKELPDRYYDTGICEIHLTAMAAGMCKSGHAAVRGDLLDVHPARVRPGLAGSRAQQAAGRASAWTAPATSATTAPSTTASGPGVPAPAARHGPDGPERRGGAEPLRCGSRCRSTPPARLRYPRDNVPACNFEDVIDEPLRDAASEEWTVGKSRTLREGTDATLIVYGALAQNAMIAARGTGSRRAVTSSVIDARFCKPLDGEMLARVLQPRPPGADGRRPRPPERLRHRRARVRRRPQPADRARHAPRHARPPDRPRDRGEQLAEVGLDPAGSRRASATRWQPRRAMPSPLTERMPQFAAD